MVELIVAVLILILYYLVFVKSTRQMAPKPTVQNAPHVDFENRLYDANGVLQQQLDPTRAYINGVLEPQLEYTIKEGVISLGGVEQWRIPIPPEYVWTPQNTVELKTSCYGGKNEFVPATGKEAYDYVEKHDIFPGDDVVGLPGQETFHNDVTDVKHLFYFKCANNSIEGIYFCPKNSIFFQNNCIHVDICRNKPDNYVFENVHDAQRYFRCENGVSREESCPPQEIFVTNGCRKPDEPCIFYEDDHIYEYDRSSYKICKNKVTRVKQCMKHEYFHPQQQKCISAVCETLKDGDIPHWKGGGKIKYALSFTRCQDGVAVETIDCALQRVDNNNDCVDLPVRTQVYDNGLCSVPKWCKNVTPIQPAAGKKNEILLPGNIFKTKLANFAGSEQLDQLYGYGCQGGGSEQPIFVALPVNTKIDKKLDLVPICQPTDTFNVPIIENEAPQFRQYYSCQHQRVESCPPAHFYDTQQGTCVADITDGSFRFKNMQLFSFKDLEPVSNWFAPRHILQDKEVCSNPDQVRIPHYNVCSDPECVRFPFLKQLKRKIYIDEEHMCAFKENQIKKLRFTKPDKDLKLNFWKQKWEVAPDTCQRGNTLASSDFKTDATVFATCNPDKPFVYCPTPNVGSIAEDTVCLPKINVHQVEIPAHLEITLYRGDIKEFQTLEANTIFEIDGVQVYATRIKGEVVNCNMVNAPYYKAFILKCTKRVLVVKRRVPTNSPEHYINIHNNRLIHGYYDHVKSEYVSPTTEFKMADHDYDRAITGFY